MSEETKELTKEQNEKKEHRKGVKRAIGITLLAAIFLGGGFAIYENSKFQSTDDAYVETTTVSVAPKVSGHIEKVFINDNDPVKEGDLVAIIDDKDYKVKVEAAQARYDRILKNQTNAKANLDAVNSEIAVAKKDLERYTALYESGAVSKQTLDNAQTKYDAVKARLTTAQENIISQGNNNVADTDLKEAKAALDQAKLDLSYTKIYAPQTGTVASRRVEKGMYVGVGTPLFVIVPENIWIVANFKENQLNGMHKGQPVEIKVDTYPKKVFKGEIDSIQRSSGAKSSLFPPENAVGSFVKIVQRVPVKIIFTEEINPDEYTIVPGMSVVPKVRIKN
ncbi:HlyD family secretion protein [bacterium]|nr:HlyD family secretion protein [bacterium]